MLNKNKNYSNLRVVPTDFQTITGKQTLLEFFCEYTRVIAYHS